MSKQNARQSVSIILKLSRGTREQTWGILKVIPSWCMAPGKGKGRCRKRCCHASRGLKRHRYQPQAWAGRWRPHHWQEGALLGRSPCRVVACAQQTGFGWCAAYYTCYPKISRGSSFMGSQNNLLRTYTNALVLGLLCCPGFQSIGVLGWNESTILPTPQARVQQASQLKFAL